ncbi:MAG: MAPEG family protein [Sphingomonadaceae bacterium]|nr:MAPEG family protein [Sphingomonadaceae bacterium]
MILPVTLTAAGVAALINIWLGARISQLRRSERVSFGDGGNPALIARMRAQANFIENTPLMLILLGLIELAQGTSIWLWLAAALFLAARIAHALGMNGTPRHPLRAAGMTVTALILLGLALYAIALPFVGDGRITTTDVIRSG